MALPLDRLISGGQTGIDQLGLEVAHALGIPTGGTAPSGYLTEDGPNWLLRDRYGLTEHASAKYPPRTRANVEQSDATLILGELTGGTKLTVDYCQQVGKPYLVNPAVDQLRVWLGTLQIKVLNVAGNRASNLSAEQLAHYRQVLSQALS